MESVSVSCERRQRAKIVTAVERKPPDDLSVIGDLESRQALNLPTHAIQRDR